MQLENASYLGVEAFDGKLQYLDQIATTDSYLTAQIVVNKGLHTSSYLQRVF